MAAFVGISLQTSAFAQPAVPAGFVELTVGNQALRGTDFVLDYGLLRNDVPLTLQVGVRTVQGTAFAVSLVASNALSVSWAQDKDGNNLLGASHLLDSLHQQLLSISLHPSGDDPVPTIKFFHDRRLVATLSFSYALEDYRLPVHEGGSYRGSAPSGVGLCIEKPPQGYRLDCSSLRINGMVPPNPKGPCGAGLICITQVACDPNSETIGYCTTAQVISPQVIQYNAMLTADYVLKDSVPTLLLLSELLKFNSLRKAQVACKVDWDSFLNQHKAEPPFQVMNEVGNAPSVHFRSVPCESLQFSYIGGHPFSAGEWVDMPYAGVRLKASGGTVLVGVLPFGEQLFNDQAMEQTALGTPGPSSALEIELIRDSQFTVGAFRIGAETPGTSWGTGFGIGSSLMTFDHPPAGTHIYTVKAKYVGKEAKATVLVQGRLVAYELTKDNAGLR